MSDTNVMSGMSGMSGMSILPTSPSLSPGAVR